MNKFIIRVLSLIVVFVIIASVSVVRTGSLCGMNLIEVKEGEKTSAVTYTSDGGMIVNSTDLAPGVAGYGGPVPVKVWISEGRVDSIVPLPNNETPGFFKRLENEGLLKSWDGKEIAEGANMKVDAVSGATFSSEALIANVRASLNEAMIHKGENIVKPSVNTDLTFGAFAALAVVLSGCVIPLVYKRKWIRIIIQILNVAVLGFWTGTFIDYMVMLRSASSGLRFGGAATVLVIMFISAFIYPLFGKANYYCNNICPYGSLQELCGYLHKTKWKLSPLLIKRFNIFRKILFGVLIISLWTGFGSEWIDYEVFSGFVVESASWIVIVVGVVFLLLSLYIPRPFCRFVCPTGSLLKLVK